MLLNKLKLPQEKSIGIRTEDSAEPVLPEKRALYINQYIVIEKNNNKDLEKPFLQDANPIKFGFMVDGSQGYDLRQYFRHDRKHSGCET